MKILNMNNRQTDNSEIKIKLELRRSLVNDNFLILDCYHGTGELWNTIKKDYNIKIYGIEKEKGKGNGLYGDNVKILKTLDLSKYNIIDLDAYGIPFDQLYEIFNNPTLSDCIIIYTVIQTAQGGINKKLLDSYGITNNMFKKCSTIFKHHGHRAFLNYLNKNGVNEVSEYFVNKKSKKHYGFFKIKG